MIYHGKQKGKTQKSPTKQIQGTWKIHIIQALIEHIIQSQSLKVLRPRNLQRLVEIETKTQMSKAFWKVHVFQTLIETIAKGQCFQG